MNVFNYLVATAVNLKALGFLTYYEDDLFITDKEILLDESMKQDQYLWIVKGTDCGTKLTLLGETISSALVAEAGSDSKFYHIKLSGINTGTVCEVSYSEAKKLAQTVSYSAFRIDAEEKLTVMRQLGFIKEVEHSSFSVSY